MAKAKTFSGGVHLDCHKDEIGALAVERAKVPEVLVFPLSQHIGAPCQPLVSVGDRVLMGQKIGDAEARIGAPIHSSVSGKVIAIEERPHPGGRTVLSIVVENDYQDEAVPNLAGPKSYEQVDAAEIAQIVREAGIVGMGGAGFPTHVKLLNNVDTVLLNGVECEPYLSADYRVMMEQAEDVVLGLRLIMKAVGAKQGYIGLKEDKPDAIARLEAACAAYPDLAVVPLQHKYPQGSEVQLIKAILGKELPPGKLPHDIGAVINNVATAAAVAQAVTNGRPLIERVVTVAGSAVQQPKNLLVRVGTSFEYLLETAGLQSAPAKVISGGTMMGIAQSSTAVPVIKTVSGIIALNERDAAVLEPGPCVRCGRCVDACSMSLEPLFLAQFSEMGDYEQAEAYHILDCYECGACTFICPARRPLVQRIRLAKREIRARRSRR